MYKLLCIIFFSMISLLACEQMDTFETFFPNLEEALKAGAVGSGKWIPEYVPNSAKNIHEIHNLDTNEVWLSFEVDEKGQKQITSTCNLLPPTSKVIFSRKISVWWWPSDLVLNHEKLPSRTKYAFFQCPEKTFLAFEVITKRAFYWGAYVGR